MQIRNIAEEADEHRDVLQKGVYHITAASNIYELVY